MYRLNLATALPVSSKNINSRRRNTHLPQPVRKLADHVKGYVKVVLFSSEIGSVLELSRDRRMT